LSEKKRNESLGANAVKSDSRLTNSDRDLIALLRCEIENRGPISFARFMELALYHPQHGYYASGRARIGRCGDFFTNVSIGPIFGTLLAAEFVEIWEKLERPDQFTLVEQGAHDGQLAADVLKALRGSECFEALRYIMVEPFPAWRERQQEKLIGFSQNISWCGSIEELNPFAGVHFSNELFDALPIHLLSDTGEECLVTLNGGEFRIQPAPVREKKLAAAKLMHAIATKLKRGVILTIDYGFTREQFFPHHTVQVRARHRKLDSPFDQIGRADISAHIDWTSLIEAAESAGARLIGLTDQHHFLTGILRDLLHATEVQKLSPADKRGLQTLLHPEMMGRNFQALALAQDFAAPLSGFRFSRL